ncbi:MAG: type II toxin-antitoxin system MqsA family antitoxin [Phycisphaerae bacterium]|nr:type II toxin-antitoxin system MqsA family antitoxin [Phycisphaerae bacterium]
MSEFCPICGHESVETRSGQFSFEPPENIPGGMIVIENAQWQECSECGEQILPPELLEALDKVRYQRLGLLAPDEIKAIRVRAGLNQTEIAQKLGIGEKTYTRWESGRSIQNRSSDTLIRLFDQNPELFERLDVQRNPQRREQIQNYFHQLCSGAMQQKPCAVAAHGDELSMSDQQQLTECLILLSNIIKVL